MDDDVIGEAAPPQPRYLVQRVRPHDPATWAPASSQRYFSDLNEARETAIERTQLEGGVHSVWRLVGETVPAALWVQAEPINAVETPSHGGDAWRVYP